ncbi:MAG: hypothetical protein LLG44_04115 [Chloroflexi bacterium]|nr:hypothetical protein [Chloroflexota bacterium]
MNKKWDHVAALTALLIFGLSLSARVRPDGFDNAGYSLTARAIVQYGTTRVDPIVGKLASLGSCGGGDCQVVVFSGRTYALSSRGDALYNYYPIGTSIAILPVIAVAQVAGYEISGANAKFLEYWLAAISVVLAYLLSNAIFRSFVSPKASWLWSTGFILASPLISTMGSALWSSNYAVVFSLASICLLIRRPFDNRFLWASSIAFLSFMSFLCKPTNALVILVILIYIFVKLRKYTVSFIINIIFFASIFITYSLITFNQLFPPYYMSGSWQNQFSLSGLWGVLASPSRGLFIYQPYLLVILVLTLKYIRKLSNNILFILIIIFILTYMYSVVSMTVWWGGFCFGSRLMAEAFPFIIMLSTMLWQIVTNEKSRSVQHLSTISLFVLFIPGILINTGQGLYNPNVLAWNGISGQSFSINKDTEYLWNWRYPQFLASADSIAERNHEAAAQELRDALPRLTNYTFGTIITPDSNIAVFDNCLMLNAAMGKHGDGQTAVRQQYGCA